MIKTIISIQNKKLILCMLLMMVVGATSCKKSGKDNTIVTIVNRLDKDVTLDLYENENDYHTNSNVIDRVVIAAGQNLELPGSTFLNSNTYYIDWYSEDYYYNNWFNDDYPVNGERVRISPKEGNNTYYLEPAYKGLSRETFIKGNGLSTSWIAIGAYLFSSANGYTNEWNTISVNERYRQVTVNKDFTANYQHKNSSGTIVTDVLAFLVQQTEVPYIEFKTPNGGSAGNMTGGKHPFATPPDYKSNSTDTIMALFPDNEYIFMMVRQ